MGLLPLPTSSHSIRLTLAASAACRRKQEAIERSHGRLQGHVALKSGVVPGGSTSGENGSRSIEGVVISLEFLVNHCLLLVFYEPISCYSSLTDGCSTAIPTRPRPGLVGGGYQTHSMGHYLHTLGWLTGVNSCGCLFQSHGAHSAAARPPSARGFRRRRVAARVRTRRFGVA